MNISRSQAFDLYRAAAVSAVVMGHFGLMVPHIHHWQRIMLVLPIKYGVPLFFIISGYLLAGSMHSIKSGSHSPCYHGKGSLFHFYYLRFMRIYPAYLVWLLIFWSLFSKNAHDMLFHILNIHNLSPDFNRSINPVFWSLAVEFQWYLLAPLVFRLLLHGSPGRAFSSFCVIVLISIIYRNWVTGLFITNTIPLAELWRLGNEQIPAELYSFALGVLVWRFRGSGFIFSRAVLLLAWAVLLGAALHTYALFYLPELVPQDAGNMIFMMNTGYISQFSLAVIVYQYRRIKLPEFLSLPVLFISLVSYSMYIVHYPVMIHVQSLGLSLWASVFLYLFLTALTAFFSYMLIEKPFLVSRWRRKN
ncbi:MAG: acyltransferase [Desulfamplus sp.]|nr:acyltransferase [Desulfamplus sp.]